MLKVSYAPRQQKVPGRGCHQGCVRSEDGQSCARGSRRISVDSLSVRSADSSYEAAGRQHWREGHAGAYLVRTSYCRYACRRHGKTALTTLTGKSLKIVLNRSVGAFGLSDAAIEAI